jgi:class 3 adenylate cyclase
VVGGVIGRKKFVYDLWGDAVNIASRMQSQGLPGRIQITEATYQLIQDQFVCEPRGHISVKGRGDMMTWFLLAEKSGGNLDSQPAVQITLSQESPGV